jgi:peptidoglycan/LPS O-acetylase OafA/YrhL
MTTASLHHARYRADIDGLRMIAILPVVLNHLGLRGAWGGFVGVDIFFVISGFLITGNIVGEVRAGRYSIAQFYRRRVLRIFPALFAMLAVVSLVCCVVMLPTELMRYARSLGAATLFGSNVLFYSEAGYFEPAARLKPLLHTWSLAIEEQFYIVWPLLLAPAARHWPRHLPWLAALVTLASLAISIVLIPRDPSAAYYLIPSRAWELSLGALLAVLPPLRLPRWLSQGLALGAIAAIAYAITRFSEATPFPGLAALLPCGGAALLILTGPSDTWVARALGWRVPVFFGQISYSLYLWHWPVIVLGSIALFLPPTPTVIAGELIASLALAILSTRYIEMPFRVNAARWSTPQVLRGGLAAMTGCLTICGTLLGAQGLPWRLTPEQQQVAAYEAMDGDALYRRGTCFAVGPRMGFAAQTCLAREGHRPTLLLLGDSHAAHYWPGLAPWRDRYDVLQATRTGCKPVLYPPANDPCRSFFRTMLGTWINQNHPDVLLLAARWRPEDVPLLERTLADPGVRAAHPVLIGPVPQYSSALPRLLVFGERRDDPGLAFRARDPQVAVTDHALAALAQRQGVPYVSMLDRMCNARGCMVWAAPGVPMQFDYGHFTREGSLRAAALFMAGLKVEASGGQGPGALGSR